MIYRYLKLLTVQKIRTANMRWNCSTFLNQLPFTNKPKLPYNLKCLNIAWYDHNTLVSHDLMCAPGFLIMHPYIESLLSPISITMSESLWGSSCTVWTSLLGLDGCIQGLQESSECLPAVVAPHQKSCLTSGSWLQTLEDKGHAYEGELTCCWIAVWEGDATSYP